jgi:beta-lactamase regulating signal transducer with metallopeptidase domain
MERVVVEYLANALWQVPALALGAWVLLRMWRPGPAAQHRVWLAVLVLGLLLPLRGGVQVNPESGFAVAPATLTHSAAVVPTAMETSSAISGGALDSVSDAGVLARTQQTNGNWADRVGRGFSAFAAATSLHRVSVSATAVEWVVGLWFAIALWGLLRIAAAWRVARRLVAGSREIALGERELAALQDCTRRMRVSPPEVRESDELAGPVVVGWLAPVLLWPEGFARCSDNELRAALCHELAHVRRRDYGMNLLCEAAALPLKWHPAAHGVEQRIRATREMACDAMAAEAMESERVYAECLVRLARSILGGGLAISESAAAGLSNGNVMEERVMRLMKGKSAMSLRARLMRGAAGAAAMLAAMVVAGTFHVVPAMAQVAPVASASPMLAPSPSPVASPLPAASASPVAASVEGQDGPSVPATPPMLPANPSAVPAIPSVSPAPSAQVVAPAKPQAAPAVPTAPPAPLQPLKPLTNLNLNLNLDVRPVKPEIHLAMHLQPVKPEVHLDLHLQPVKPEVHLDMHLQPVVTLNGQVGELTPAERAKIDKQMADAKKQIAEAKVRMNSPEFKKQMADAQRQIAEATAKMNSPEFKKEMADAQKQVADAMAQMNSPEFKKQMADAQKQVAEAMAKMNSPEFKKQMADAQKQVAEAMAKMKADQQKGAAK